ncbi:predicted protein [Plenodomus lingam JN3]|uniref:Predicted protein n=1 Tax=Leptosphaeria maculans (strain JN3 / isolate v23.1.3 / race Av1-4-5-6-7-8) TaxID=985895 RepID=E5R573_LEPMJ|nr:predicted protein [Plenodomus lingam JN3]CBX92043.1 predicted protein [Plenodomus lingam JN3]
MHLRVRNRSGGQRTEMCLLVLTADILTDVGLKFAEDCVVPVHFTLL